MRNNRISGILIGILILALCIPFAVAEDLSSGISPTDSIPVPTLITEVSQSNVNGTVAQLNDTLLNSSSSFENSNFTQTANVSVNETGFLPIAVISPDITATPEENPGMGRQPVSRSYGSGTLTAGKDQSPDAQKLSTDLLGLVDPAYLPPGFDQEQLRNSMIAENQLEPASVSSMMAMRSLGRTTSFSDSGDLVYVYITTDPQYPTSIADPYVAEVTDRDEPNHILAARVDVNNLPDIASVEGILTIQTVIPPVIRAGSIITEGDSVHHADAVRSLFNVTGSGVKIGIVSMGIEGLAVAQASGDIPSSVHAFTVPGDSGSEGTAILEIIHDIAPGAELYYQYAGKNKIAFENAIDNLTSNGCSVIYDDIGWVDEPFFEDGDVANHVKGVISNNSVLYVSAAGNYADSHYQGMYHDDIGALNWTNFSVGSSAKHGIYLDIPSQDTVRIVLEWDDPFRHSVNDYDLYLINATNEGQNFAWSIKPQSGTQDPLEIITYKNNGSSVLHAEIAVNKYNYTSPPKTLELYIYPDNPEATIQKVNIVPEDSIYGHPAVPGVIATGAVDWYPSGNQLIEYFSSRGPVTIRYPVPESRSKPDIIGSDGVNATFGTGAGHFHSFWGTSAAGAHIAGILGLEKSAFPQKSPEILKNALFASAKDLGTSGYDTTYGWGLADAHQMYAVLNPLKANFTANVTYGTEPLTVKFSDLSLGSPTRWNWTFGDGRASEEQNPIHVFSPPGNYSVSLMISNGNQSETKSILNFIQVVRLKPFPGYGVPPTDLNADGLYEDLNGNNRLDFDDVIVLFNNMEWIPANSTIAPFDFNRNGRIDFDDIIQVFNKI